MKRKSHMKWAWIIMVAFLTLGIYDFRFGILGFGCMIAPIFHALKGKGKVHCQSYCPRGSILAKFLAPISMNKNMPAFMTEKVFKYFLLTLMIAVFSLSLSHAGLNFNKIAFSVFRFMSLSLILGMLLGIFYKPRSWCVICPMGTATGLVSKVVPLQTGLSK